MGLKACKYLRPIIQTSFFLDLRQDDFDGIAWIQTVREISQLPILVLSDHEAPHDKVLALDAGADEVNLVVSTIAKYEYGISRVYCSY